MELPAVEVRGTAAPPTVSHLFVAQKLIPAAEYLATTRTDSSWAVALMCGQAAENIIRAVLSQGYATDPVRTDRELKKQQHNLVGLWAAVTGCSPFGGTPPQWLANLNLLHSTYQLRYADGFGGFVIPNPVQLVANVKELLSHAQECISKNPSSGA